MKIPEPTPEQCSKNSVIFEDESSIYYAVWYPQMGGYSGKAVARVDKNWEMTSGGAGKGGCIDIWVWHDGEFPFSETEGNPKELHHCDPEQFIHFGEFLQRVNDAQGIIVDKLS